MISALGFAYVFIYKPTRRRWIMRSCGNCLKWCGNEQTPSW